MTDDVRKVAIIGSRTFPVIGAGPAIFDWLKEEVPLRWLIYTRGSKGFDAYLTEGARFMGYTVIEMKGTGGADNYLRDVRLVEAVDSVHAFFDEEHLGEGGTQHVIDKALDQHKPSHSYIWDGRRLICIGSDDGEGPPARVQASPQGRSGEEGQDPPQRDEQGRSGSPVWPAGIGDELGF